ncbi:MAG: peroxide stress protein YaaA [Acidimicrobiia bacterium]
MVVVLLPPSEGKAAGGAGPGWAPPTGRFAELAPRRLRVANALKRARGGNARMLGATGTLLATARATNRALVDAPTLPAWQRFTGVVWEHLDPAGLGARGLGRARDGVIVVSAVTGLSAWDDPVPDFRLKFSAALPPMGRLAAFWREPLSAVLNHHLTGRVVVDLLPNEHREAWTPEPARYTLVRPVLATQDGKPAGHAGKATKGRLARALLQSGDVARTLAAFDPGELDLSVE